MIVRNIGRVNVPALLEFQEILADITKNSKKIEITSPAGMAVKFENDSERPVFTEGKVTGPGDYMLFGQVDWAPIEETINGIIVFDGLVWPPRELGLLKQPIFLDVEEGKVTKIRGGWEAKIFEKWLKNFDDKNMFNIAHISYGCNPGAKLTGNILEDEQVWGVVEWGLGNQAESFKEDFGATKSHTDGICLAPTMKGDGEYIIKEGEYVHPKLLDIQKKLVE